MLKKRGGGCIAVYSETRTVGGGRGREEDKDLTDVFVRVTGSGGSWRNIRHGPVDIYFWGGSSWGGGCG